MSIEAAAKELTKEIERLSKEAERLTRLRDSLQPGSGAPSAIKTPLRAKPAAKKSGAAKSTPVKKRVLSPEGRRKIIAANRRMWAKRKRAAASEKKKAAASEK